MQSRWIRKGKVIEPLGWFATTSIIVFLVFLSVVVTTNIWYQTSLKPKGAGMEKIFVIKKGESAEDIAQNLEGEGLIKSSLAFRIYLFSNRLDNEIEAGSFRLNPNQSVAEIAEELKHGQLDQWITLVEGLRVEEMAELLFEEFDIDQDKFVDLASEGYMFPDTYLIPSDANEQRVVTTLRNNFNKKVGDVIKNQAEKSGLTVKELIIIASIVERESRATEERPIIAGILLKRLEEGIPLAADATVQYALGYQKTEKSWWKKGLTVQDLEVESPYNTRKVAGLPPTPICNPGLSSIKAAVNPQTSPYYYYIHDKNGKVHFAETFAEHQSNIEEYLR